MKPKKVLCPVCEREFYDWDVDAEGKCSDCAKVPSEKPKAEEGGLL